MRKYALLVSDHSRPDLPTGRCAEREGASRPGLASRRSGWSPALALVSSAQIRPAQSARNRAPVLGHRAWCRAVWDAASGVSLARSWGRRAASGRRWPRRDSTRCDALARPRYRAVSRLTASRRAEYSTPRGRAAGQAAQCLRPSLASGTPTRPSHPLEQHSATRAAGSPPLPFPSAAPSSSQLHPPDLPTRRGHPLHE